MQKTKRHSLVGPANRWKMKRAFQRDFLLQRLQQTDYILDIGCGTLRGGIPIISFLDKQHYYGIDVRKQVIEEAKKELKQHNLSNKQPIISVCNDMDKYDVEMQFDAIWCFSVLFHMVDEQVDKCFYLAQRLLKQDSKGFYANVFLGDSVGEWQGFPVIARNLNYYKEKAERFSLTVRNLGTLLSLGHNSHCKRNDEQLMLQFNKRIDI